MARTETLYLVYRSAAEIYLVHVDEPETLQKLAERDMPAKLDLFFIVCTPTIDITSFTLQKLIHIP